MASGQILLAVIIGTAACICPEQAFGQGNPWRVPGPMPDARSFGRDYSVPPAIGRGAGAARGGERYNDDGSGYGRWNNDARTTNQSNRYNYGGSANRPYASRRDDRIGGRNGLAGPVPQGPYQDYPDPRYRAEGRRPERPIDGRGGSDQRAPPRYDLRGRMVPNNDAGRPGADRPLYQPPRYGNYPPLGHDPTSRQRPAARPRARAEPSWQRSWPAYRGRPIYPGWGGGSRGFSGPSTFTNPYGGGAIGGLYGSPFGGLPGAYGSPFGFGLPMF